WAMGNPARLAAVLALALATSVQAQTPAPSAPQRAKPLAPTVTQVIVRDRSGTALGAVHISASGTNRAEATTDAKGGASLTLPAGSYRLRFEREGFITLEREIVVKAAQTTEVEVALALAPAPPAPEPPPPPAP